MDGNKRLAWRAPYVFLAENDVVLAPTDDETYELVIAAAAGDPDDVSQIARALGGWAA